MTSEPDDIMNKINSLKTEYYLENKKNIIFKNNQKFDCATTIVQNINKTEFIRKAPGRIYALGNG